MTDTHVPKGSRLRLGVVDGNLEVQGRSTIEADGSIRVAGTAQFRGDVDVVGSLECREFRSEDGHVHLSGDLTVADSLTTDEGELEIGGKLSARDVDVDRRLTLNGPATVESIEVGGRLEGASTLTAHDVSVGGKFVLQGKIEAHSVEAGGSVD